MKPLVLLMRNIFDVGLGGNHEGFLWTHSLSTTTLILAIINSFFSIMSLLTSNKITSPLLTQCKATQNKIAWAHCMFFADQVVQLLDVFPTRYRLQSIQIVRKALFFNLISALVSTRSFPRGFSLATPNYVLCRRLPSLLQNCIAAWVITPKPQFFLICRP
jgi:hypothetical protein